MLDRKTPLLDIGCAKPGIKIEKRAADVISEVLCDGDLFHGQKYVRPRDVGGRHRRLIGGGLNDSHASCSDGEQLVDSILGRIICSCAGL